MAMSRSWIDAIFTRLSVRYGAAFLRQYADLDPDQVKDDWAHVLDGVGGPGVVYGLENLPADRPPTALQFRQLVNGRPRADDMPAIGYTGTPASPAVVKTLQTLGAALQSDAHPHRWANKLIARREAGEVLSVAQREALERFSANVDQSTEQPSGDGFNPIPAIEWPWNRKEAA